MGSLRSGEIQEMGAEFEGVSLGDERLDERLLRIVELAGAAPSDSFPDQMESVADREALYRFLGNPRVTMQAVLSGHIRQTHARICDRPVIRILHDTSTFHFPGEREGLGRIRGGAKGFLGHVALAVAADETREPLGVLGVLPYIHRDAEAHEGMTPSQRVKATESKPREARESSRWERLAIEVANALPQGVRAIHVMDQEADDYALFAALHQARLGFVIRGCPERLTADDGLCAKEVLAKKPERLLRTVYLTPRSRRKEVTTRGRYPARTERNARLKVRWGRITIRCRPSIRSDVRELSFPAVYVFEPNPPRGAEPI
jgi:hypothetical protein